MFDVTLFSRQLGFLLLLKIRVFATTEEEERDSNTPTKAKCISSFKTFQLALLVWQKFSSG